MCEGLARSYMAVLTCIEEATADPAWLGQDLSGELVAAFEQRGIDPCGERGEYHTVVTAGPLFRALLRVLSDNYCCLPRCLALDLTESRTLPHR